MLLTACLRGMLGHGELPVLSLVPAQCWVLPSLVSTGWAPLALTSTH